MAKVTSKKKTAGRKKPPAKKNAKKPAKQPAKAPVSYINLLGHSIEFPPQDKVVKYLHQGWYEASEQIFISRYLRPGDCFIDCGAHAGLFSVLASERVGAKGHVIAVEPNTDILPYLEKNLETKAKPAEKLTGKLNRTTIFATAIAEKTGTATLYRGNRDDSAFASLYYGSDIPRKLKVKVTTLDAINKLLGKTPIRMIKLDLEGGEAKALLGAKTLCAEHSDIVIMLEFAKENIENAGEDVEALKAIISDLNLKCARYDSQQNKLIPVQVGDNDWYANYFLTHDLSAVNKRLGTKIGDKVERQIIDFDNKSKASTELYQLSEAVPKIGSILHANIASIAATQTALSGNEDERTRIEKRFEAYKNIESPEQGFALLEEFSDELGRLAGSSSFLTKSVAEERQQLQSLEEKHQDLMKQLAETEANAQASDISPEVRKAYLEEIERLNQKLMDLNLSTVRVDTLQQQVDFTTREKQQLLEQLTIAQDLVDKTRQELHQNKGQIFETDVLKGEIQALKNELDIANRRWSMRNDISNQRDEAYEELLKEFEDLLSQLSNAEVELRQHKKSSAVSSNRITELTSEKDSLSSELKTAHSEHTKKIQALQNEAAEKDSRLEAAESQAQERQSDIEKLKEELENLAQSSALANKGHEDQVVELTESLAATQRLSEQQTEQVNQLKAERRALEEKIEIFREARDEMVAELRAQHVEEISSIEAEVEVLKSQLEDSLNQLENGKAETLELQNLIQEKDDLSKQQQAELEQSRAMSKTFEETIAMLTMANDDMVTNLKGEHEVYIGRLQADINRMESELSATINENASKDDKLQALSGELVEAKGTLDKYASDLTWSESERQKLQEAQERLSKRSRNTSVLVNKSTDNLAELLEEIENSRFVMQKLIAETQATKSSRWVRFGKMIGVGPKDTLDKITDSEHEIKAHLHNISGQLRQITEGYIENISNYGEELDLEELQDHDAMASFPREAVLKDLLTMGQHAEALQRSKMFKIAKLLGFKSSDEIQRMLDIFYAKKP